MRRLAMIAAMASIGCAASKPFDSVQDRPAAPAEDTGSSDIAEMPFGIRVKAPSPGWKAVRSARVYEQLFFLHTETKASIGGTIFPSALFTPHAMIEGIRSGMAKRPTMTVSDAVTLEKNGSAASFAGWMDLPEKWALTFRVVAFPLAAKPEASIVLFGIWPSERDAAMSADMDKVIAALKDGRGKS